MQWVNGLWTVDMTPKYYTSWCLEITGSQPSNPLPNPISESIAEEFANYFIDKINKICSDLDKHGIYKPSHMSVNQKLSNFKPMTNDHVIRIINSMTTKTCESDPINTTIFKKVAHFIIDEITAIINISLLDGVFANQWKNAIVHPLLKRQVFTIPWKITGQSVTSPF